LQESDLINFSEPFYWLLSGKRVQFIGFLGCGLANFILATAYQPLKDISLLFFTLYILQLSFQSLPGVTTMAISAEILPSMVRGTGAGISAALGKVGATVGTLENKFVTPQRFWSW